MRTIASGPYTLACHERGESGERVICLHSSGFSSRQWKRLADLLAPDHRVLLPDLIGYGASSPLPEGTPFHFHDDVAALLPLLDEPAHLVAHSYGGLLALHLALARPAMVRSLALYEPVAFGILDEPSDADARAAMLEVRPYDGEPWLERFVDWWQGAGAWAQLAPEARAGFIAVGWKTYCEVSTLVLDPTDRARFATIAAPAHLFGGARSPLTEQRMMAKLAQVLPHATRVTFPDMGHLGPITHAAIVNAAIAAAL